MCVGVGVCCFNLEWVLVGLHLIDGCAFFLWVGCLGLVTLGLFSRWFGVVGFGFGFGVWLVWVVGVLVLRLRFVGFGWFWLGLVLVVLLFVVCLGYGWVCWFVFCLLVVRF